MTRREWGPGAEHKPVVCGAMVPPLALADVLTRVERLRAMLAVPVQPLRADRVVSALHVDMAAWHATRAAHDGRARSDDPAVEFLLYVAGDRQIRRALEAFGFLREAGGLFLFVALVPVDPEGLSRAVAATFHAESVPWPAPGDPWDQASNDARRWWVDRQGLPPGATARDVEDAVLAAMADLAVARL